MILNEEFLLIYEELSELNEAKADTQRLIDFAGEDLANRFLAAKGKFKYPENDLYYWIKNKTVADLEQAIGAAENAKSNRQLTKEIINNGAKLVLDTEHWKVYHITTFDAAVQYGKDTKWCITGLQDSGDKYWNKYKADGADFYFLITNGEYDPRGRDSKFALVLYEAKTEYDEVFEEDVTYGPWYEVYDQQDYSVLLEDVPFINEIKLPGVDFSKYEPKTGRLLPCEKCGAWMTEEQAENNTTIYGDRLCLTCLKKDYEPSDRALAEKVVALSMQAKGIMAVIMENKFAELSEPDIHKIINSWQKGRKNNLFKKYTDSKLLDCEAVFIQNLKTFMGIEITRDMLQGKVALPANFHNTDVN
jgi:hypothetical protein